MRCRKIVDRCPRRVGPGVDKVWNITLSHPGLVLVDFWLCKWITIKLFGASTGLANSPLSRVDAWSVGGSWLHHCLAAPWHCSSGTKWPHTLKEPPQFFSILLCPLFHWIYRALKLSCLFSYFPKPSLEHKLFDGDYICLTCCSNLYAQKNALHIRTVQYFRYKSQYGLKGPLHPHEER